MLCWDAVVARGRATTGAWLSPGGRQFAGRAAAVGGLVIVAIGFMAWMRVGNSALDTGTYLGAGERLNAGHEVYSLKVGDRPIPLLWKYPLLYPPLIAVLWRPLALLGDLAKYGWWAID